MVAAPGHADGQLCLLQDGVLIAADHMLDPISPTVGLWPASRPDPLGDYLAALETTIALDPTRRAPGHGDPIHRPVGRARELIAHHDERLAATAAALSAEPRSGLRVSHALFGRDLKPAARRFAIAETLSHLERLVREGSRRTAGDRRYRHLYCRAEWTRILRPYLRLAVRGFPRRGRAAMSDVARVVVILVLMLGTPSSSRPNTRS